MTTPLLTVQNLKTALSNGDRFLFDNDKSVKVFHTNKDIG